MNGRMKVLAAARGADVLVRDQFRVKAGEVVLVTADTASDLATAEAILAAAVAIDAKPALIVIPQLPFQGTLADPFVPETLAGAVTNCDVWFDLTFPYLAGSHVHDQAMQAQRPRYLLLGDLTADGLRRLYGTVELDQLFVLQHAFDNLIVAHEGAPCRITSPAGTDVTFTLGKTVTRKLRHTETPGSFTPPGVGAFYPEPDSVTGEIFLDAVLHEHYVTLPAPMRLVVEGEIRELRDGGTQAQPMDRALRRASNGGYGRVIHFAFGFHPSARFAGVSFIEDIRTVGANAIGLGMPWWEPGGGENHPDGVVSQQSLWIDGEQISREGVFVGPTDLLEQAKLFQEI